MISVRNISFRYENVSADVLHDISFEIAEGSFTAVMGANGSGKSTLARCLNGLLQPTSGSVCVDGLLTSDFSSRSEIRRRVGFVFQDPNVQMTSATIERELAFGLQNFRLPTDQVRAKVDDELNRLNFDEQRLAFPSTLSGGEKQRLALASVLLCYPKYLVLDEPTSFLSPSSRAKLMDELARRRRASNTAIVLITQFSSEALLAERLIVLQDSTIVFDNPPARVFDELSLLNSLGISVSRHA